MGAAARVCCFFLTIAILAGCGGNPAAREIQSGIDGTGAPLNPVANGVVAYGTVTALGSVWVNGVHYDTASASIVIDGEPGTQADLHVGDVVLVVGRLLSGGTSGVADRVLAKMAVKGPIESIDSAGQLLVALGQRVSIDGATSFDDSVPQRSLAGLAVGDVIEVAGLRNSRGEIVATRIAVQAFGVRQFSTTGVVSSFSTVTRRFSVDGLVVDYSTAMIEGFPTGAFADGDLVEVKGSTVRGSGELVASSVTSAAAPVAGLAGDRVEIEGYVTDVDVRTPLTFRLAGLVVTTTPATVYEGGAYISLAGDAKVEVEGTIGANGTIVAAKVRFVRASPVVLGALVDAVDAGTASFVVLGISVRADALTRIEDRSAAQRSPFTLSHLSPGDFVRVAGVEEPAGSGNVVASLIERHDSRSITELQGYVQAIPYVIPRSLRQPVVILGVTATATDMTIYPFMGGELGEATFFFDLVPGTLLMVRGVEVADREIVATEMQYIN